MSSHSSSQQVPGPQPMFDSMENVPPYPTDMPRTD